ERIRSRTFESLAALPGSSFSAAARSTFGGSSGEKIRAFAARSSALEQAKRGRASRRVHAIRRCNSVPLRVNQPRIRGGSKLTAGRPPMQGQAEERDSEPLKETPPLERGQRLQIPLHAR